MLPPICKGTKMQNIRKAISIFYVTLYHIQNIKGLEPISKSEYFRERIPGKLVSSVINSF